MKLVTIVQGQEKYDAPPVGPNGVVVAVAVVPACWSSHTVCCHWCSVHNPLTLTDEEDTEEL
jgi:hypothetical protein